jgi:hypothetical protein
MRRRWYRATPHWPRITRLSVAFRRSVLWVTFIAAGGGFDSEFPRRIGIGRHGELLRRGAVTG